MPNLWPGLYISLHSCVCVCVCVCVCARAHKKNAKTCVINENILHHSITELYRCKWRQFDKSAGSLAINYDVEISWQLVSTKNLEKARLRTSLLYLRDVSTDADAWRICASVHRSCQLRLTLLIHAARSYGTFYQSDTNKLRGANSRKNRF